MKKRQWILGCLITVLAAGVAASAENPGKGEIPGEEYEVYAAALEALKGASSVDRETLRGLWADYLLNFFEDPVKPSSDLVQDFNEKNQSGHFLSESFVQASKKDALRPFGEKRKATFSRVGFDRQREQALLIVGLTYVVPEDVMNEGKFVLLRKKEGKWAVEKTLQAWRMRLGEI